MIEICWHDQRGTAIAALMARSECSYAQQCGALFAQVDLLRGCLLTAVEWGGATLLPLLISETVPMADKHFSILAPESSPKRRW